MRAIKFRAWDGKEFLPLAREVAFIDDDGVLCSRIEGIIFTQYTGVQDRQGKEIYEGDILRLCYSDGSAYEEPVEVKFGLHSVGYDSDMVVAGPTLGFYFSPYAYGDAYDDGNHPTWMSENFTWEFPEQLEVIGNIYENPDLLPESEK